MPSIELCEAFRDPPTSDDEDVTDAVEAPKEVVDPVLRLVNEKDAEEEGFLRSKVRGGFSGEVVGPKAG